VHLVGGQPRAIVLTHRFDHVVDEPLDFGGTDMLGGHRPRHLAQDRVAEPGDL
jgi:hypothetical protein